MNEELDQLLKELTKELNSEELSDLNDFIKEYLEEENSPRSLVYILNKLENAKILKLASKSGRTISLLLEFIMANIDTNICEREVESIKTSNLSKANLKTPLAFEDYSKEVIDSVIDDVITTIDMENNLLNENYYEEDGTFKIRIL